MAHALSSASVSMSLSLYPSIYLPALFLSFSLPHSLHNAHTHTPKYTLPSEILSIYLSARALALSHTHTLCKGALDLFMHLSARALSHAQVLLETHNDKDTYLEQTHRMIHNATCALVCVSVSVSVSVLGLCLCLCVSCAACCPASLWLWQWL